jgi:hypothetical protein
LLIKSGAVIAGGKVSALGIIVKAHMFPSSNSTLYYEQAVKQIEDLTKHGVVDIPIRVIGLFAPVGVTTSATWTEYPARYGRMGGQSKRVRCLFATPKASGAVCKTTIIP